MKNEIKIPSMGESISEVTIGTILAPSGSIVQVDAEVVELETDKVNQVLFASHAGRVELTVRSGDVVSVGQTIGTIDSSGVVDPQTLTKDSPPSQTTSPPSQAVKPAKEEPKKPEPKVSASSNEHAIQYTKEEFLADLKQSTKKSTKIESQIPERTQKSMSGETRRPMSKIRKVIAQRLVEAQHTTAMLTTFNEVDLTQVIQLREKYKEVFTKKHGCKLGFMSFFVTAVISALKAFPDVNSYINGDEIVHREYYNIGVAVGTEKGVIVPVIRNCDQLSFAEIERAIENYAKQAREGTLYPNDLTGGGFTITNGGIYGSLLSTPILLPPQCGILGMHKIQKRAVVIDDEIVIRSMMYLALSYDHRLIDGKEAVSFLVHLKQLLEDPSRFLLDI